MCLVSVIPLVLNLVNRYHAHPFTPILPPSLCDCYQLAGVKKRLVWCPLTELASRNRMIQAIVEDA